jgi:protein-tyrosine phosphatase
MNIGVQYLSYTWLDSENQVLFEQNDKTTDEIYNFINDAMNKFDSVLVHSVRG